MNRSAHVGAVLAAAILFATAGCSTGGGIGKWNRRQWDLQRRRRRLWWINWKWRNGKRHGWSGWNRRSERHRRADHHGGRRSERVGRSARLGR